jgi:arylsulfatase A-like enzyme
MRALALLLVTVLLAAPGCSDQQEPPAGPYPQAPVIILGLDTVRGDHLHVAGKNDIQTPHLDALAADGVRFAQCQSTAPWTAPAFASLLTGVTPYRHGYLGGRYLRLGAQQVTLAEHLQQADYATGAFVSIDWLTADFGMAQGFDDHHFLRPRKRKNGYLVTRRGLEYAAEHASEPFLLFMHYFDAHAPYTPPAPFDRMYYEGVAYAPGDKLLDFLKSDANKVLDQANREHMYEWLEGVTDPEYPVKQYAAGVSYVDHEVGQVIAGLKAAGLYDQSLIIAISDHGEHLGEHDLYFTHALPWQETVHVPLIIKWPESRYAGRVVQRRVSILDLLPTVFGVRGVAKPNNLDGRDLTEVLTDPDNAPPSLLISETGSSADACWKTLVVDDWKLLVHWSGAGRGAELYDLKRDPLELKNVAEAQPDVVARLLAELGRHVDLDAPLTTQEPVGDEHLSDAVRHKLRSLGYVH